MQLAKSTGIRDATLSDYNSVIRILVSTIPGTKGPNDISPELAQRFKRIYSSTSFTRGKSESAKTYTRSANTVRAVLRKLSSLWAKHFSELGYVGSNPWEGVPPPPQVKRRPAVSAVKENSLAGARASRPT